LWNILLPSVSSIIHHLFYLGKYYYLLLLIAWRSSHVYHDIPCAITFFKENSRRDPIASIFLNNKSNSRVRGLESGWMDRTSTPLTKWARLTASFAVTLKRKLLHRSLPFFIQETYYSLFYSGFGENPPLFAASFIWKNISTFFFYSPQDTTTSKNIPLFISSFIQKKSACLPWRKKNSIIFSLFYFEKNNIIFRNDWDKEILYYLSPLFFGRNIATFLL
jgi:hypothetical protein